MIERILPGGVAVSAVTGNVSPSELWPQEAALIARSAERRRQEFTAVRYCARKALGALGVPPAAILPGPRGEPRWPVGVVGSMTHCAGYRAAAVARAPDLLSLGIDAEPDLPLPHGVLDGILRPEEAELLRHRGATVHPDRLLFSAKESTYKAWFPLTGRWLDFSEASVEFTDGGTFTSRLLVPGPEAPGGRLQSFHGRWAVTEGLVLTSVVVPYPRGS